MTNSRDLIVTDEDYEDWVREKLLEAQLLREWQRVVDAGPQGMTPRRQAFLGRLRLWFQTEVLADSRAPGRGRGPAPRGR